MDTHLTPADSPNTTATNRIQTALASTVYGSITSQDALVAMYAGLTDAQRRGLTAAWSLPDGGKHLVWHGHIPGARGQYGPAGDYIVANPYSVDAIRRVASRRGDPPAAVLLHRSGLGDDAISLHCVACAEIDDVSLAVQADRLAWLEGETGIAWSVLTLSGDTRPASIEAAKVDPTTVQPGKSIHAFFALVPTSKETWTAIQTALVALLRSDPAITNAGRLMRSPGVLGYRDDDIHHQVVRIQTVLAVTPGAYDALDVLTRLQALAVRDGITDIDAAYTAITFAEITRKRVLGQKSKIIDPVVRQELIGIAARAKLTRTVTDADRLRVAALTGRHYAASQGGAKGGKGGGLTTRCELPADTVVTLADGRTTVTILDPSIPKEGWRCFDPDLEDPTTSHSPSARIWPGGRIYSEAAGGRIVYHPAPPGGSASGYMDLSMGPEVAPCCPGGASSVTPAPPPRDEATYAALDASASGLRPPPLEDLSGVVASLDAMAEPLWGVPTFRAQTMVVVRGLMDRDEAIETATEEYSAKIAARVARTAKLRAEKPEALRQAQRVVALADELLPTLRGHFRGLGLTKEGCRFRQGLYNPTTNEMVVVTRRCRSLDCPHCAAGVVALKVASILVHLGRSPLYAYEYAPGELSALQRSLQREPRKTVAVSALKDQETKSGNGDSFGYALFQGQGGGVAITPIAPRIPLRGPIGPLARPLIPFTGTEIREYVVTLALRTYTVGVELTDAGIAVELAGGTHTPDQEQRVTRGKLTASKGITLDPETLLKSACNHTWLLEASDVDASKFEANAKEDGLGARISTDEQGAIASILVPAPLTHAARRAMWERSVTVKGRVGMPAPIPTTDLGDDPAVRGGPDFDALLDAAVASSDLTLVPVRDVPAVPAPALTEDGPETTPEFGISPDEFVVGVCPEVIYRDAPPIPDLRALPGGTYRAVHLLAWLGRAHCFPAWEAHPRAPHEVSLNDLAKAIETAMDYEADAALHLAGEIFRGVCRLFSPADVPAGRK